MGTKKAPPVNSGVEVNEGTTKPVRKHSPDKHGEGRKITTISANLPYGRMTIMSLVMG